MLGELATEQAKYDESQQWIEEALAIAAELATVTRRPGSSAVSATAISAAGDLAHASHFAEQYLVGSREFGDRAGICYSLGDLGEIARLHGDLTSARMLLEESIRAIPEGTDLYSLLISLHRLGGVTRLEGDLERATDLELESLRLARTGQRCREHLACSGRTRPHRSRRGKARPSSLPFPVSAANRTRIDAPIPTYLERERENAVERSHAVIGRSAYLEASARGLNASLDAVVDSLIDPETEGRLRDRVRNYFFELANVA